MPLFYSLYNYIISKNFKIVKFFAKIFPFSALNFFKIFWYNIIKKNNGGIKE